MKIPTKVQANIQSQELKRQQISEGSELVQRIEALRKVLNSLQEQHKHFVEASKGELERQTTEYYRQRDDLKAEVETLTIIREELKKPLDEEWKKARDRQSKLDIENEKLSAREYEIDVREGTLKGDKLRTEQALEKAEILLVNAEKKNQQAEKDGLEAEKVLKEAQNKREKIEQEIAKRISEVEKQEEAVDFEHKGVIHIHQLNSLKEAELLDKEREIKDKYETLQRTIKRKK